MHESSSATGDITAIDPPSRRMFFRIAMTIVALEPLIIVGVLIVIGVPWWIIGCIAAFGVTLVTGIFWLIAQLLWKPWRRRYPAQPVLPRAVSQSWQSFGFGRFGRLNNCVTIIADERHLHLVPFAMLRWVGAGVISLPFDRMHNLRKSLLPGQVHVDLDGRMISGPEWAMELARRDP